MPQTPTNIQILAQKGVEMYEMNGHTERAAIRLTRLRSQYKELERKHYVVQLAYDLHGREGDFAQSTVLANKLLAAREKIARLTVAHEAAERALEDRYVDGGEDQDDHSSASVALSDTFFSSFSHYARRVCFGAIGIIGLITLCSIIRG